MTTTIFLIRHAAHAQLARILSGRLPDVPLSDAGRSQARQLAERLAQTAFAAIHTSPVQRARETADMVADAQPETAAQPDDALDEVDFGAWAGRSFDTLADDPDWHAWNTRRGTADTPGGERMRDVQRRVMARAARLAAQHPGANVALVSHCDVIRAGLAGWLGLSLDHVLRFDVDPASVSRVAIGEWGARVLSINEGGA